MASLLLFNKPFGVLSQFTTQDDKPTLAEYIRVPKVYAAGRLDHDSEGLLLLTDDGDLQHHIAHPAHKQPKTYWVQVEGAPNSYALTQLRQGVTLNDGITQPAEVKLIAPPRIWERNPPIRARANIPTQWMEITISEGKNRQVRRMTAAVGHPTLRLVRVKIGPWTLEGIAPGTYKLEQVNAPKAPGGANRARSVRTQGAGERSGRGVSNGQPNGRNRANTRSTRGTTKSGAPRTGATGTGTHRAGENPNSTTHSGNNHARNNQPSRHFSGGNRAAASGTGAPNTSNPNKGSTNTSASNAVGAQGNRTGSTSGRANQATVRNSSSSKPARAAAPRPSNAPSKTTSTPVIIQKRSKLSIKPREE